LKEICYHIDMSYRRNADETIRDLERAFYSGNTTVFDRLVSAYIRAGILPVSFLVEYPTAFPLLPREWQQALWEQAHTYMTGNPPPPSEPPPMPFDQICDICLIEGHSNCSLTPGCPCCEDTIAQLQADEVALAPPEPYFDDEEEEEEEEDDHAEERERGEFWECASCGEDCFADGQGETWALLTEASAAITTAKIGRGDAGQAMCDECLSQADLDVEEAAQEDLEGFCSQCYELDEDCVCDED
jgi:hypothetical protein